MAGFASSVPLNREAADARSVLLIHDESIMSGAKAKQDKERAEKRNREEPQKAKHSMWTQGLERTKLLDTTFKRGVATLFFFEPSTVH